MLLLLIATLAALADITSTVPSDFDPLLQGIFGKPKERLFAYPTDLTREIYPRGIHSHNDYWRDLPFYSALSVGCVSIEADIWLYNDTLYIGHEPSALTPERTFSSLYIDPILSVLERQNPAIPFVGRSTKNGVFDGYSSQTLYLFIDVKTDGLTTWPYVIKALEPLRSCGYLSSVGPSSNNINNGPITVIGTGNTPLSQVQSLTTRDVFYDAPIPTLSSNFSNITNLISPITSADFAVQFGQVSGTGRFNDTQLALLRAQVATAHAKGIAVRYWDQPEWPVSVRNGVWKQLWEEGVDLINVDDVGAAAGFSDCKNCW